MALSLLDVRTHYPEIFPHRIAALFPHIFIKLQGHWGAYQFLPYVDSLTMSTRWGRKGFSGEIISELMALKQLHQKLFPYADQTMEARIYNREPRPEVKPIELPKAIAPEGHVRDDEMLHKLSGHEEAYPAWTAVNHPRLFSQIKAAWGSAEADRLLDSLFLDDSGSPRFSREVIDELLLLSDLHMHLFPPAAPNLEQRLFSLKQRVEQHRRPHADLPAPPENATGQNQPMNLLLGEDSKTHYPHYLEFYFLRIFNQIPDVWYGPDFDHFIEKLCIDERREREGFPPEVMEELLKLAHLHMVRFPAKEHRLPWQDES